MSMFYTYMIQNVINNVYIFAVVLALATQFQVFRNYEYVSITDITSLYVWEISVQQFGDMRQLWADGDFNEDFVETLL